jgi:hypothetical protein
MTTPGHPADPAAGTEQQYLAQLLPVLKEALLAGDEQRTRQILYHLIHESSDPPAMAAAWTAAATQALGTPGRDPGRGLVVSDTVQVVSRADWKDRVGVVVNIDHSDPANAYPVGVDLHENGVPGGCRWFAPGELRKIG